MSLRADLPRTNHRTLMHKTPCFIGSLPKEHAAGARLFMGCKVTTHGDPTVDEPQGRHVMDRRHGRGPWGSGKISGFVLRANRHGSHSTPKCREIHDERRVHQRRPRSLPMPSRRESREVGGGQVQPLTDQLTAQLQCPNHGEGDHSVIVRLLSTNQRRAWLFVAIKPFSVKAYISLEF